MRIAIISPNFAEYSVRLAVGIASADPSTAVRVFVDEDALAREATEPLLHQAQRIIERFAFAPAGWARKVVEIIRIAARVARFRPTVIQVHEHPDAPTTMLYQLLSLIAPVVSLVHDPQPHSGRDTAYAARQQHLTRRQRSLANGFLVHGSYCRDLAIERIALAGRQMLAIPHGGILVPAQPLAHVGEPGRVLMFGRMEVYKGLEVLLESLRELRRRGVPVTLHLAGQGPELTRLSNDFIALGGVEIDDGYLTPDTLIAAIGRAAVIVAPYLDATQSGVVAAALENGRPVVASATGGLCEAVNDGVDGILIPPGDPQALADALAALLHDSDKLAGLSQGARTSGRAGVAWKPIGSLCLNLYRDLARD